MEQVQAADHPQPDIVERDLLGARDSRGQGRVVRELNRDVVGRGPILRVREAAGEPEAGGFEPEAGAVLVRVLEAAREALYARARATAEERAEADPPTHGQ